MTKRRKKITKFDEIVNHQIGRKTRQNMNFAKHIAEHMALHPRQLTVKLKNCSDVSTVVDNLESNPTIVNAIHASCALQTISSMRKAYISQEELKKLERVLISTSAGMDSRIIENILRAITKLNYKLSRNTWLVLEERISNMECTVQLLESTLKAWAKLRYEPLSFQQIESSIIRLSGEMTGKSLQTILKSLTRINVTLSPTAVNYIKIAINRNFREMNDDLSKLDRSSWHDEHISL